MCTHEKRTLTVGYSRFSREKEEDEKPVYQFLIVPLLTGSRDFPTQSGMRFPTGHLFDCVSECPWIGPYLFIHLKMLLMV